ncbi:MAG TPA: type II 3-dehydroquinate dehydratase [Bacteroidota bacterium]|nr:type II 3-dehydroquinate dehydratase [Bacteroidota bacterium]
MRILVANGPNVNLLGKREPEVYGTTSLWDIENHLKKTFPDTKFEFFQSNSEGALIDVLQKAFKGEFDAVVLNPGAYAHYSYAIRDCVAALPVPTVEVHITNVHAREQFRHNSVIAPVCKGVLAGFGAMSYELAVRFLIENKSERLP